jgi:AAA ATPase domain
VGIAASGPLVGRVAELAVLDEAIGSAAAGSAQVVAISGEGGIGKSRLALEGVRSAEAEVFVRWRAPRVGCKARRGRTG